MSWLGRHSSPSLTGLRLLSAAYMLDERIHTFKLSCVLAHLSNGCLPASERFATAAADSRLAGVCLTLDTGKGLGWVCPDSPHKQGQPVSRIK